MCIFYKIDARINTFKLNEDILPFYPSWNVFDYYLQFIFDFIIRMISVRNNN